MALPNWKKQSIFAAWLFVAPFADAATWWKFEPNEGIGWLSVESENPKVSMMFGCSKETSLWALLFATSGPIMTSYGVAGNDDVSKWANVLLNAEDRAGISVFSGDAEGMRTGVLISVPTQGFAPAWKDFRAFCDAL